jgi:hypothetical protein
MFDERRLVKRSELLASLASPHPSPEWVGALLKRVAVLRPGQQWELVLPTDQPILDAIARDSALARRVRAQWSSVAGAVAAHSAAAVHAPVPVADAPRSSRTALTETAGGGGGGGGGGEGGAVSMHQSSVATMGRDAEVLQQFLLGRFEKDGVLSLSALLRELAAHPEVRLSRQFADGNADGPKALDTLLTSIAHSMHGGYVLKALDAQQIDKYRDVILKLFVAKNSVKKAEIKAEIKSKLSEDVTMAQCEKVLKEFAVCKGSLWTFKVPSI